MHRRPFIIGEIAPGGAQISSFTGLDSHAALLAITRLACHAGKAARGHFEGFSRHDMAYHSPILKL
jgi:hypothetical protein